MDRAVKIAVEAYALELVPDENKSGLVCPFCASKDASFSVKKVAGGILFNCYRESCKADNKSNGFLGTSGVYNPPATRVVIKEGSPFLGDVVSLTAHDRRLVQDAYGISDYALESCVWGIDPITGRYIIPVKGRRGQTLGHMARTPPGSQVKPKTIAYVNDFRSEAFQAWYLGDQILLPDTELDRIVLVEDQWSAMKVVQTCPRLAAVALLGTNMSHQKAYEIGLWGPDEVLICLDKDATRAAFDMRQQWALHWGCRVTVLPLGKDLKDTDPAGIRALLCDG